MAKGTRRFALLAAAVVTALSMRAEAQSGEPFAFKGVLLGSSEEQLLARFSAFQCQDSRDKVMADRVCTVTRNSCAGRGAREPMCQPHLEEVLSYGGAAVSFLMARFYDGKLSDVSFTIQETDYVRVTTALTDAFGNAASRRTEVLQNRMGARFENSIAEWKRGGSRVTVTQRSAQVDQGFVSISLDSVVGEYGRRKAAQTKGDKKDL